MHKVQSKASKKITKATKHQKVQLRMASLRHTMKRPSQKRHFAATSTKGDILLKKISASSLKGTRDYFPDITYLYRHIQGEFEKSIGQYGYNNEIRTPILESAEVFGATLGVDSDVVMKQMYQFDDYGILTVLRPENTASVVRAVVKRGINPSTEKNETPLDGQSAPNQPGHPAPVTSVMYPDQFFYCGPMFRRERPQNGRLRQFTQFGVENIGSIHPHDDIQLISMAYDCLKSLGMENHIVLAINSIGILEERKNYEKELAMYLQPFAHMLSPDSKKRYQSGHILRILDSSDEIDLAIVRSGSYLLNNTNVMEELHKRHHDYMEKGESMTGNINDDGDVPTNSNPLLMPSQLPITTPVPPKSGAPLLRHFLSDSSLDRFNVVLKGLHNLNIPFETDDFLIRGLDYYSHTTFEFLVDQNSTDSVATKFDSYHKHRISASQGVEAPYNPLTKSTPLMTLPQGSYQAILAGGRYGDIAPRFDKFKSGSLALQPLNIGIGWASGIDRVILHMERLGLITPEMITKGNQLVDIVVVTMGAKRQLTRQNHKVFLQNFLDNDSTSPQEHNCDDTSTSNNNSSEYRGVLNNVGWGFNKAHIDAMQHQMYTHHLINKYNKAHGKVRTKHQHDEKILIDHPTTSHNQNSTQQNESIAEDGEDSEDGVPTPTEKPPLPYSPLEVESIIADASLLIASKLRRNANKVLYQPHLPYQKQLGATHGAKFAIIIGENEVAHNAVLIKNMISQQQDLVKTQDIVEFLILDSVFEEQMQQQWIMEQNGIIYQQQQEDQEAIEMMDLLSEGSYAQSEHQKQPKG